MKRTPTIVRILLGTVFIVFGLDGVVHFFPLPPMPPAAQAFLGALQSNGLFYAVKALEITAGLLLLRGRRVPLALTLLGPILFNILWFDATLDPASLPIVLVLLAMYLSLVWRHRDAFAGLVRSAAPA